MHMNTDMYINTHINMYKYMCVLWCRVMSCVARRCWLVGWVGGWVWCGDVVVSSCGGPCLESVPVSYGKYIATGKSGAFND